MQKTPPATPDLIRIRVQETKLGFFCVGESELCVRNTLLRLVHPVSRKENKEPGITSDVHPIQSIIAPVMRLRSEHSTMKDVPTEADTTPALDARPEPVTLADTEPIVGEGTLPDVSLKLTAVSDRVANPTDGGLARNTEYTFFCEPKNPKKKENGSVDAMTRRCREGMNTHEERVPDDPRGRALRAAELEERAEALPIRDLGELEIGRADRPGPAAERERDLDLRAAR
ncbi:hypothetical protein EW146_g7900 [Bondarzewia mesenterica]|uniref:Uncharacterized protein n=1 Tax=Bondarzewia mesenterica TaxID=1095465 RepID=A0A4V3XE09_9AGAM|nr:hypothetical protein EW146_g7900 [Bondarzewia mesenterica]